MPKTIFKAKCLDGFIVKVLFELLHNNFKTGYFTISKKGIHLCMTDANRKVLVDLMLEYDKFNMYKYKKDEEMRIGLNLGNIHKLMKSIRKKNTIIMYITEDKPDALTFKVIPNENTKMKKTEFSTRIYEGENITTPIPDGYDKSVIVNSNEFQKTCKEMSNISSTIQVTSHKFSIKFFADGGNIYSKSTSFGEDESDSEESESDEEEQEFDEKFDSQQLIKIVKIAGLGADMQIFPKANFPLLFKSSIGHLGHISIFLKSIDMANKDNE